MAIIYLNGDYIEEKSAHISPLDRGFLFSDAVYEVVPIIEGKTFCLAEHLTRLGRSLKAVAIKSPSIDWAKEVKKLIASTKLEPMISLYIHISRGTAAIRNHAFPADIEPTVLMTLTPISQHSLDKLHQGITAVTLDDIRWDRCDIKSTALLASVILQQQIKQQAADEAILIKDGLVTEGTACNMFMVQQDTIITPPVSNKILAGITREQVIRVAQKNNIPCIEQKIKLSDLDTATELWITSSTKDIVPIISLNKNKVGDGKIGVMWHNMSRLFKQHKLDSLR